jgi:hypothetical protein
MGADSVDTSVYWMSGGTLSAANNSGDPSEVDGSFVDFHLGADDGDPTTDDTALKGDGIVEGGKFRVRPRSLRR